MQISYDKNDTKDGQITYKLTIDAENEDLTAKMLKDELPKDYDPRRVTELIINSPINLDLLPCFPYLETLHVSHANLGTENQNLLSKCFQIAPNVKNLSFDNIMDYHKDFDDIDVDDDDFLDMFFDDDEDEDNEDYDCLDKLDVLKEITIDGYRIPSIAFKEKSYGVVNGIDFTKNRIAMAKKMIDLGISITDYNLNGVENTLNNVETTYSMFYKEFGFLDVRLYYDEEYKEKLEQCFIDKYGRVPKIFTPILQVSCTYNIPPETVVDNFDVSRTKSYLNNKIPASVGSVLMSALSKNNFDKAIESQFWGEIAELCADYFKKGEKRYLNAAEFLIKHPSINQNIVDYILGYKDTINFDENMSTEAVISEISKARALGEIAWIENNYPEFHFNECKFNLKFSDVETDTLKAGIMRPGDIRMVTIGYDTHCCQHLDGEGETAMMYGLVADNAGFWIIEDKKTNKILAQAEIWEKDENTLIFDNIEFADKRDISRFSRIIGDWAKNSEYDTILMGNGYNVMKNKSMTHVKGVTPPVSEKVMEILGISSEKYIYTDASGSCSVIKMNGKVEPYFLKEQNYIKTGLEDVADETNAFFTLDDYKEERNNALILTVIGFQRKHNKEITNILDDIIDYGKENDWDFSGDKFEEFIKNKTSKELHNLNYGKYLPIDGMKIALYTDLFKQEGIPQEFFFTTPDDTPSCFRKESVYEDIFRGINNRLLSCSPLKFTINGEEIVRGSELYEKFDLKTIKPFEPMDVTVSAYTKSGYELQQHSFVYKFGEPVKEIDKEIVKWMLSFKPHPDPEIQEDIEQLSQYVLNTFDVDNAIRNSLTISLEKISEIIISGNESEPMDKDVLDKVTDIIKEKYPHKDIKTIAVIDEETGVKKYTVSLSGKSRERQKGMDI